MEDENFVGDIHKVRFTMYRDQNQQPPVLWQNN